MRLYLALFGMAVSFWLAIDSSSVRLATSQLTATPVSLTPVPTIDRLAPPPTVSAPTQADEGAQLYWLHCQPCHGDQGQGLTDEWREQYPPEDRNCWNSGCHGDRPYEDGFTLPTAVPPLIGADSLAGFQTGGQLYRFTQVAMPFQAPGSLSSEEYLAITAFLVRAHNLWDPGPGTPLTIDNVEQIHLQTDAGSGQQVGGRDTISEQPTSQLSAPVVNRLLLWIILAIVAAGGVLWLWRRYRS